MNTKQDDNVIAFEQKKQPGGGGTIGNSWLATLSKDTEFLAKEKNTAVKLVELKIDMQYDKATRLAAKGPTDEFNQLFYVHTKEFSDMYELVEILFQEDV